MMPRRLKDKGGLTLIELTLVTLLILTLIGLAIPLFKGTFQDIAAKDASFNISKLINYAQEMAVLQRKQFRISFDLKNGRYQLFEMDDSKEPVFSKKLSGRFGRIFALPKGISLRTDRQVERQDIYFYPDGHCDTVRLEVLAKKSGYSLTVKRFGNMVDVKEVSVE